MDKDAVIETTPPWYTGELGSDEAFDTSECNRRARFDPDAVESIFCHINAGCAIQFTPRELRDWLRRGHAPDPIREGVVVASIAELGAVPLRVVVENCGASIREFARFVRNSGGPRHWKTTQFLNSRSRRGSDPLPYDLDKQLAAGDADWWR